MVKIKAVIFIFIGGVLVSLLFYGIKAFAGTLSCSVTTAAACTGTVIWRMSNASNAHAELPSQSTAAYANNVVCCSGVTGLGNACTGTFATALKLSGLTNAHVEQNSQTNYANNACVSVPSGGSVSVGYQATNCTGFDTTLGSMSTTTNAHVGNGTAYTTQICATAAGATTTVSCSTNIGSTAFGTLTTGAVSTASPDASTTISCSGTAAGCTLNISDTGLATSSPAYTIASTTGTLAAGTEGWGIQATTTTAGTGGTLTINSIYNKSGNSVGALRIANVALASSTVDVSGREVVVKHLTAISSTTQAGSYSDTITYSCTAN